MNEGELFAFAKTWDRWKDPSGNVVETCSILTTTPNAVIAAIATACRSFLIQTVTTHGLILE